MAIDYNDLSIVQSLKNSLVRTDLRYFGSSPMYNRMGDKVEDYFEMSVSKSMSGLAKHMNMTSRELWALVDKNPVLHELLIERFSQ